MITPTLKIKRLNNKAKIPKRMTEGAVGLDIYMPEFRVLWTGDIIKVCTGIAMEIPSGYHGEVHIRSSYGIRGIRLANCTGIIDSDYRGELVLYLINDNRVPVPIYEGERIAQFVLVKDPNFKVVEVDKLSETERGEGGFGSTNIKE